MCNNNNDLLAGCGSSNTGSTTGSAGDTAAEDTAETADFAGTKLVIGVESGSPNIEFFKNNVSELKVQQELQLNG